MTDKVKNGCKSRQPKYCSKKCYGESLKLNIKCKLCGFIIENKHSASMKNRIYKRKKSLKEKMPIEFLKRILKAQDNKCFFCECDLSGYKAIEHLTPVSKGGDNNFYNLVYSCKSCNSKKRQQTLEEFALNTCNIHWLEKWEKLFIEAL